MKNKNLRVARTLQGKRKQLYDCYGIEPIVETAHWLCVAFGISLYEAYEKIYELHLERLVRYEL